MVLAVARGDGPDGPAAAPAEGGERAAGCPGIRSSEAKWLAMGVDGWTSSR